MENDRYAKLIQEAQKYKGKIDRDIMIYLNQYNQNEIILVGDSYEREVKRNSNLKLSNNVRFT